MTISRRALLGSTALLLPALPALAQDGRVPVVVSFTILADIVKAIGADAVSVVSLVGPDRDAHTFSPSPNDAKTVAAARVVIINGLGFEGWADRLVRTANYNGVRLVATKGIKAIKIGNAIDPHAWQDPANVKVYAANIRDALSAADPARAALYAANADRYIAELDKLDAEIKAMMGAIPREKRKIITSHDAFTYFGDAYDVDFLSPQGVSTEAEPTPQQISRIIRQIKAEGVKAVFVENMANRRVIDQITRETGAVVGGTLYADALGSQTSYLAMMRHNASAMAAAMK